MSGEPIARTAAFLAPHSLARTGGPAHLIPYSFSLFVKVRIGMPSI